MEGHRMDHQEAIRLKLNEQYLLGELSPEQRDEFEEHYFDCRECANDVRTGALFVQQSKILMREERERESTRVPIPVPPAPPWLAWLRPVVAAPLLACLLAFLGFQNLVTIPKLTQSNSATVMPAAYIKIGTYSSEVADVTVRPGQGFLIDAHIPPDSTYTSYVAKFYNPAGKLETSLPISLASPSAVVRDQYFLRIPAARASGTYLLVVAGVSATGDTKEVGRRSIEVKVQ
jgi:hypothetical protein